MNFLSRLLILASVLTAACGCSPHIANYTVEHGSQAYDYTFVFEITGTKVVRGDEGSAEGGIR